MDANEETIAAKIRKFLAAEQGAVFTIVNMTRKEVGLAAKFDEEVFSSPSDGSKAILFVPKCPNAGIREEKLTKSQKGTTLVPMKVTAIKTEPGVLQVRQLRYVGSKKNDLIVVVASSCKTINTLF